MTPIQTRYKGYRFRSRLEARWAVFFDAMNIEWEYEPEGYVLEDGSFYLPDFYTPKFAGGGFFEVKPNHFENIDVFKFVENKLLLLSKLTLKPCYLLLGVPDFYPALTYHFESQIEYEEGCGGKYSWHWGGSHKFYTDLWDVIGNSTMNDHDLYTFPCYDYEYMVYHINRNILNSNSEKFLKNAIQAARSSRFEHGESPVL